MTHSGARWRAGVVTVAAVLVLVGCSSSDEDAATEVAACGEPTSTVEYDRVRGLGALPVALLPTLEDPEELVCTTSWEGMPAVVNLWATWCPPCVEEMPSLQAAHESLGDRVRFVGIQQPPGAGDDAIEFLQETGVEYEQVAAPDQGYFDALGARGMPTTLFVEADGTVVWRHVGQLTEDDVLELVAEHLGVDG